MAQMIVKLNRHEIRQTVKFSLISFFHPRYD